MIIPIRTFLRRNLSSEKGSIGVISGVAFTTTLMMMSLTLDLGYVFMTQSEMQNAADAGALAAVSKLPVTLTDAQTNAGLIANQYRAGDKQVTLDASGVQVGSYDFDEKIFNAAAVPVNASRVAVSRNQNVASGSLSLFFARLFGIREVGLDRFAVAAVDPRVVGVKANNHMIPYSVSQAIVDANGDGQFDIGSKIDIYLHNGSERGNFGFLNLDGGSLGTDELTNFLLYGFNQDFVIPSSGVLNVLGDTGIRGNSLTEAFEQMYFNFESQVGPVMYMPVHRAWSGNGANSIFEIVDLVAIRLKKVQLNGNINARNIEAEIVTSISSAFIVREGADSNNSMQKLRLVQ